MLFTNENRTPSESGKHIDPSLDRLVGKHYKALKPKDADLVMLCADHTLIWRFGVLRDAELCPL